MQETTATTTDEQAAAPDHAKVGVVSRHLSHPVVHIVVHVLGLVAAHTAALLVIDKTPLLVLMLLH
jgi:hypothetical protein